MVVDLLGHSTTSLTPDERHARAPVDALLLARGAGGRRPTASAVYDFAAVDDGRAADVRGLAKVEIGARDVD